MNYKEFCYHVAKEAGEMMKQYFYGSNMSFEKWDRKELVTQADRKINEMVIDEVKKHFPEHGVLWEEDSFSIEWKRYLWCCDPIDGTIAFAHGIPTAVFSLALLENGKPIVWCVYQPFLDELYFAEQWKGSIMNERKIGVSSYDLGYRYTTINCMKWPGMPYDTTKIFDEIYEDGNRLLEFRTVAYMWCLIAKWAIEWIIFWYDKPRDCAAIDIIVKEAWGVSTDLFGKEQRFDQVPIRWNILSNWIIHHELVDLVDKYHTIAD